jgi:hypothetical protein
LKNNLLKILVSSGFLSLIFFACTTRPYSVLSEKKMEEVMFDMYIAEAEVTNNYSIFASDSSRKRQLLASVFNRHGITQEKFDSSLVWYAANLDKYLKINENLDKRYVELIENLTIRKRDSLAILESELAESSKINLEKTVFFLTSADFPNGIYCFWANAPLPQTGGEYELSFDIIGLTDSLEITFNICCNDTVFARCDTLATNGSYSSSVDVLPSKTVQIFSGVFRHLHGNPDNLLFINRLSIKRKFETTASVSSQ